jgi:hypothetical protein
MLQARFEAYIRHAISDRHFQGGFLRGEHPGLKPWASVTHFAPFGAQTLYADSRALRALLVTPGSSRMYRLELPNPGLKPWAEFWSPFREVQSSVISERRR